jgi:tRNA (cytidine32/guanosine34-2'-O)-methyltransferase
VFDRVHVAKPRSSRASSIEAFVVCEGYRPIKGWTPEIGNYMAPLSNLRNDASDTTSRSQSNPDPQDLDETEHSARPRITQLRRVREDGITELTFEDPNIDKRVRWIAPFLACGDLSALDSDATYQLPPGHVSLDPVQPPTEPPYKEAMEKRRAEGGAYGKTKYKDKGKSRASTAKASEVVSSAGGSVVDLNALPPAAEDAE